MADMMQQIDIAAPIEAVWAELTKLGSVQKAMMDTILDTTLEPGAPLRYTSRDGNRTFIVGRIVDVQPPSRLSHTYVLTTRDDPPSLVTWTLEQLTSGVVRVTVAHTGWADSATGLDRVDKTWAGILAELKRLLETGDVSFRLKTQYGIMRMFLWAMPAKTKTANVEVPS